MSYYHTKRALFFSLCFLLLASATVFAQADKVTFTATIQNRNSDSLVISGGAFTKIIRASKKGVFIDAFAVTPGIYQLFDGKEYARLYLKNGYNLDMAMDAVQFDETISFKGNGATENNFLAKKTLDDEAFYGGINGSATSPEALAKTVNEHTQKGEADLAASNIDENLKVLVKQQIESEKQQFAAFTQQLAAAQKMKNTVSPGFAFENAKGGITKLEDFRGKYVYIDVWATWCHPCREEIPFLQKLEEKYKGKNIAFVSISADVAKDHDKWKKLVETQSLGGTQLIADHDWKSDFLKAYNITAIPRFIIIDPQGNIVDADAKRPSDPATTAIIDALLKTNTGK